MMIKTLAYKIGLPQIEMALLKAKNNIQRDVSIQEHGFRVKTNFISLKVVCTFGANIMKFRNKTTCEILFRKTNVQKN